MSSKTASWLHQHRGQGVHPQAGMVTRATVFQTLYNAQGKPEVGETTFADVKGKWYASAAAWAEEVGLARCSH